MKLHQKAKLCLELQNNALSFCPAHRLLSTSEHQSGLGINRDRFGGVSHGKTITAASRWMSAPLEKFPVLWSQCPLGTEGSSSKVEKAALTCIAGPLSCTATLAGSATTRAPQLALHLTASPQAVQGFSGGSVKFFSPNKLGKNIFPLDCLSCMLLLFS